VTLGADKAYDSKALVQELREHRVTPHFALKPTTIIDQRTTRHPGYEISQRKRKRIEEIFGWLKTFGGLAETRHRGRPLVDWIFCFAVAGYNLCQNAQPGTGIRMSYWDSAARRVHRCPATG
jgi:Transposase DDE domain